MEVCFHKWKVFEAKNDVIQLHLRKRSEDREMYVLRKEI
jgi:hypothetical protein